ncbi:MFS transporter [Streptomyces sp. NPDC017890]|uniref:MFS transporter n=1 Tax=Streptomyces sp. NPDC017890 TaxID=3365015 RepID=UPI00379874B3
MTSDAPTADPRRWKALVVICLAELMVVLDGTVMNIALPTAQRDLGFSDAGRQWVVTAYALPFGGLLLLGGRVADLWNRRSAFVMGAIGFAAASALGGCAVNTPMLMAARAFQGVFGALLAPAALSLLAVTFPGGKERAKAFGIYAAIAGAGSAIGLLLGGVLTEYLNWRWTLLVNIVFSAAAALGALCFVGSRTAERRHGRHLDVRGALLATSGLMSLVYGFTRAESDGWSAPMTLGLLAGGVLLLAVFVAVESRAGDPLLPPRVLLERNRGGAYLCIGITFLSMFGLFLFLAYYLQTVLGFRPLACGLAFLPLTAAIGIGATQLGPRLTPCVPTRAVMVPGFLVACAGLVLLTRIAPDSSYAANVLPGLLVLGLGLGTVLTPAVSLATHRIEQRDAGVASAMITTSQQIGGAIGTALLNTIAATATAGYLRGHTAVSPGAAAELRVRAAVHGYSTAIWAAAGFMTLAAVLAAILVDHRPGTAGTDGTAVRPGEAVPEKADGSALHPSSAAEDG